MTSSGPGVNDNQAGVAGSDETPPASPDGSTGPAADDPAARAPVSDDATTGAVDGDVMAALAGVAADLAAAEIVEDLELAGVARERDEYLDALKRLQADFENYKKRMVKQQTEFMERAAGTLVSKLLPVCDTADLAIAHGGGEEVKQVWTALMEALEREGLERIDPAGVPFDPTVHEAVAHEPGVGAGGPEVTEVLRAGYRWKGRVLRPAMVKVRG